MDLSGSESDTTPEFDARADRAALRAAFARRLNEEVDRRKWTLATLLREATPHLAEGFKLSHSHLWHYLRGKALPHDEIRRALSLALGTNLDRPEAEPAEPPVLAPAGEPQGSVLLLEDLGGGRARLRLDQEMPWPQVLRIVELIRGQVQ